MTFAQHHPRGARGESLQRALLISFSVTRAVAEHRDGIVRAIHDGQMNQLAGLRGLDGATHIPGALEQIAARNPAPRLAFAEHNRVEDFAVRRLHGQHAAALLLQTGQRHPGLQSFFAQIGRQCFGHDERIRAGQDQPPATHHRAALGPAVHLAQRIAQVAFETPSGQRHRQLRGYLHAPLLRQFRPRPRFHLRHRLRQPANLDFQPFLFRAAPALLRQLPHQPARRVAPAFRQAGADFFLQRREFHTVRLHQRRRVHHHLARTAAGEDAVERIKILLADRIKLVVVAARAGNRQTKEGLGENIDLIVHDFHLVIQRVHRHVAQLDHPQLRRAENGFVQPVRRVETRLRQQIAGEMFADELVVGQVAVEGANEIVTVTPGHRQFRIALAAVRFAIAHQIHPMPRPALAETRRGQQPIHYFRVGLGRRIVKKLALLRRRRRQAREREGDPTQQ